MEEKAMTDPVTGAVIQRDVKFNIYSGVLSADEGAILKDLGMTESDGKKRLRTTASSNIKDLSGDEMSLKALQKMATTAEENMTIFLNHRYQVPEDVLGSVEKATIIQRGADADLDFIIRVEEASPRAVTTYDQIRNGTKLGTSIGALIPAGGATKSETGLLIDDVQLLEASIVGIPANPRSFVQYAMKALEQAAIDDAEEGEVETSGPPRQIRANVGHDGLPRATPRTIPGAVWDEKAQVWVTVDTDDAKGRASGTPAEESTSGKGSSKDKGSSKKDSEADITKEAAPPAAGDEGDPTGNEPEPTTEATQEAPVSAPESDGATEEVAVDEQVEAQKSLGLDALAGILKATTHALVEARKDIRVEAEKTAAAETRASEAEGDLLVAKQIVERIAALPIGRKTSFATGVSDFRKRYGGLYGDEIMQLMEKEPDD